MINGRKSLLLNRTFARSVSYLAILIGAGFAGRHPLNELCTRRMIADATQGDHREGGTHLPPTNPGAVKFHTTGPELFELGGSVTHKFDKRRGIVVGEYDHQYYEVQFACQGTQESVHCGDLEATPLSPEANQIDVN